jgi:hypothetical protein
MRRTPFALLFGVSLLLTACSGMNVHVGAPGTGPVVINPSGSPGRVLTDQIYPLDPQMSISHQVRRDQSFPEIRQISDPSKTGLSQETSFRSWSLFLMPDDDTYTDPKLVLKLKKAFDNLGRAIGEDNVSIWLVTGGPEGKYDYERAQQIISELGIDSATGPYIVITLSSPNKLSPKLPTFVARLTGLNYDCYSRVVDDLAIYINDKHYDRPALYLYNSQEQLRIDMAKFACAPALLFSKLSPSK